MGIDTWKNPEISYQIHYKVLAFLVKANKEPTPNRRINVTSLFLKWTTVCCFNEPDLVFVEWFSDSSLYQSLDSLHQVKPFLQAPRLIIVLVMQVSSLTNIVHQTMQQLKYHYNIQFFAW